MRAALFAPCPSAAPLLRAARLGGLRKPACCVIASGSDDHLMRVTELRARIAASVKLERFSAARVARDELHEALAVLSDAERVTEATGLFYTALRDADLDAMSARWADGNAVSCVSPFAQLAVGKSAVEAQWMNVFRYGDAFVVDFRIRSVRLKAACAWTIVDQTVQSVRGKEIIGGNCVATNVFRRAGAEWLLLHHHSAPVIEERVVQGEEVQ